MIPAIDSGIGLKEDRPAPKVSSTGSQGFSRAFERARGHDSRTEARKPLAETRPADDPRAREQYGTATRTESDAGPRRTSAPKETPARDTQQAKADGDAEATSGRAPAEPDADAAAEDSSEAAAMLAQAAQAGGNTALQAARLPDESLADAADDPTLAAQALEMVNPGQNRGTPDDATPITAQIGAAAYRLGQHSPAEKALAEARGIVLPDSTQAQMMGEGVRDVRFAALQASEAAASEADVGEAVASEKDLLKASKVAEEDQARNLSYREQIALQTAKNRNEVLARLAVNGEQASGASDALRQQMQLHGLLARSAREHAVEGTSPNTPPTAVTGAGLPAGSVDLTRVFETPHDDAVEHRVLERVANEARWLIRNNRQEVSLRLNPEHLGSLHMKVVHQDGQFRVDLTVDNLAAKHLLESNLQDLRNRLIGDNPGGEFLFNVDVRQGNEQPNLYSRAERVQMRPVNRIEGLEQAPAPGLAGRVLAQDGLSIYA